MGTDSLFQVSVHCCQSCFIHHISYDWWHTLLGQSWWPGQFQDRDMRFETPGISRLQLLLLETLSYYLWNRHLVLSVHSLGKGERRQCTTCTGYLKPPSSDWQVYWSTCSQFNPVDWYTSPQSLRLLPGNQNSRNISCGVYRDES